MLQKAIDRRRRRRRKAEERGLNVEILAKGHILLVESRYRPRLRPDKIGRADMIEMCVGVEEKNRFELMTRKTLEDLIGHLSRIEYDGRSRLLASEDDAVTLKRSDRKGFKDHVSPR